MKKLTEYQKMIAGDLYDAGDQELLAMRVAARNWMKEYNASPFDKSVRQELLKEIFHSVGANPDIQSPFFCDYGSQISVGDNFFANFNCIFLDCNRIEIGNNVSLGPGVQIYTASHPVMAFERIKGPEFASPIKIGDNVWIGGGAILCAGVTIGENTTIGAGSVVTKIIPPNVLAAGNPCRVIRYLI
ncbi:MAG: sugar O-acetyltransferase [Chitinophagales bacterium]